MYLLVFIDEGSKIEAFDCCLEAEEGHDHVSCPKSCQPLLSLLHSLPTLAL